MDGWTSHLARTVCVTFLLHRWGAPAEPGRWRLLLASQARRLHVWQASPGRVALQAVALQQDQKIVLVTTVEDSAGRMSGIVMRFNPDGSDDKTFNGSGFVLVELPGVPHDLNFAEVVATQPDGAVVVCGTYAGASSGAYIARFEATGRVNTGFGENGVVTIAHRDWINLDALSITENKIVIAGGAVREGAVHGLIAVLTFSGSYNLVFNGGKPLYSDFIPQGLRWLRCVARVTDGSIVVSGSTGVGAIDDDLTAVTARFLADGSLDPAFNGTGFTVFDEDDGFEYPHDMTVLADGRVVVGGVFFKNSAYSNGWMVRYLG